MNQNRIKKAFYKGFSTRNYEERGGTFDIYNVECIQQDLLNEIFTIKGERLHMPRYGTRIPLMVFELDDLETQNIIREDLVTVFGNDKRIELLNLDVLPMTERSTLIVIAKVNYKEFEVTKDLRIEINSR